MSHAKQAGTAKAEEVKRTTLVEMQSTFGVSVSSLLMVIMYSPLLPCFMWS
jgi:hypothetical protein